MDFLRIIEEAENHIEGKGADRSSLARKLGFSSRYIADIKAGKSKKPGSDFVLALINKLNFSPLWLETGKGEMFLSPKKEEKDPLLADLEAIIDKRVDIRLAEMEKHLMGTGLLPQKDAESDLYALEPEPEYEVDQEKTPFVENIAAGWPIYQSDDRSLVINVPRNYMRGDPKNYYVGRIKGTSMVNTGIPDGCLALFRISDVPRNDAIQIVEHQGEATVKRMREVPGKGWRICFEDGTGRYIEVGPGEEPRIQGDFVAILPDHLEKTIQTRLPEDPNGGNMGK